MAALISRDAGMGIPEIEPRDFAVLLLPDLDYEAQLVAIRELLANHARVASELTQQLRELEEHARLHPGLHTQQVVDEWTGRVHASVYQDAAHSMAAVGMLAPLVESLFHQVFMQVGRMWQEAEASLPTHPRFQQEDARAWDCHYVPRKNNTWRTDILAGTRQLADATGLTPFLSPELWLQLAALFAYRNKMFHNGFEWPLEERRKFARRASREWPPEWFSYARSGGEPWIGYMDGALVAGMLKSLDDLLEALGRFAGSLRERLASVR